MPKSRSQHTRNTGERTTKQRRVQGKLRKRARVLPQMEPFGDLTVAPGDPRLGDTNPLNIPHHPLCSLQSNQQSHPSSIALPPAEGGRAQRKGRSRVPTPVKRINSCFRKRRGGVGRQISPQQPQALFPQPREMGCLSALLTQVYMARQNQGSGLVLSHQEGKL